VCHGGDIYVIGLVDMYVTYLVEVAESTGTRKTEIRKHWNMLQHAATHCNTLQHTAAHCNTLQHTALHKTTERSYTAERVRERERERERQRKRGMHAVDNIPTNRTRNIINQEVMCMA